MNRKFAICYNPLMDNSKDVMQELKHLLDLQGVNSEILSIDSLKSDYEFVFVIGGDGTILKAARFYSEFNTPIFGVNLGRLGFLSQASRDNLDFAVSQILNDNFKIEKRMMLKCQNNVALNDFVIKGDVSSGLHVLHCKLMTNLFVSIWQMELLFQLRPVQLLMEWLQEVLCYLLLCKQSL